MTKHSRLTRFIDSARNWIGKTRAREIREPEDEVVEEAILNWQYKGTCCFISRVYGQWKSLGFRCYRTGRGTIRFRIEAWWLATCFEI